MDAAPAAESRSRSGLLGVTIPRRDHSQPHSVCMQNDNEFAASCDPMRHMSNMRSAPRLIRNAEFQQGGVMGSSFVSRPSSFEWQPALIFPNFAVDATTAEKDQSRCDAT